MKGGLDLTQDIAMEVFTAALVLALKLGLPVLIAAVVIGLNYIFGLMATVGAT